MDVLEQMKFGSVSHASHALLLIFIFDLNWKAILIFKAFFGKTFIERFWIHNWSTGILIQLFSWVQIHFRDHSFGAPTDKIFYKMNYEQADHNDQNSDTFYGIKGIKTVSSKLQFEQFLPDAICCRWVFSYLGNACISSDFGFGCLLMIQLPNYRYTHGSTTHIPL